MASIPQSYRPAAPDAVRPPHPAARRNPLEGTRPGADTAGHELLLYPRQSIAALLVAGLFTLLPQRLLGHLLWTSLGLI
ncbi:MAG: hypothetical protein WCA01_15890 [Burkholderiales bacterium]